MNEAAMSAALDKIHQLAGLVLQEDLPRWVSERIELIQSIARYKHDVSSPADLPPEERPTDDCPGSLPS